MSNNTGIIKLPDTHMTEHQADSKIRNLNTDVHSILFDKRKSQ